MLCDDVSLDIFGTAGCNEIETLELLFEDDDLEESLLDAFKCTFLLLLKDCLANVKR